MNKYVLIIFFLRLIANEQFPLYVRKEYQNANTRLLALIGEYDNRNVDSFLLACVHYAQ